MLGRLSDRSLKVATPLTAATAWVPLRVAPPGFVVSEINTVDVSLATKLSFTSSTSTVTAGLIDTPAAVVLGCCTKAIWLAI